ncbi:helix-turn-helix domain-containing protein [Verrucosispora sp. WMMD1129]|uniref:helix-turn-helix transcriptional regulator n=1 Tax=Verrucosispora sp. WMMD1129 TaxID=3016093 RepID=UPI002499F237|nr:helix-turn-helix domain-containing protein [Verrucosispora sp. WMMD1129]WFE46278.1 helix-turn-helix domain-containing protein [Verrucosispora sp. WMMD1129]
MSKRSLAGPPEVATYLNVPEKTLTQWRYLKTGPRWSKVGRHIRYRWEDVEKWLDEKSSKAAA